jgi:hypothetical protein
MRVPKVDARDPASLPIVIAGPCRFGLARAGATRDRRVGPGHDLGRSGRPRVDPDVRRRTRLLPIFQRDRDGTADAPTSSTMKRSLLSRSFVPSALLLFFIVPACAPDATSSKQPLAVCQEGDDGCPSVPRAEKQPSSKSSGPSGDPSTPTPAPNEEDLASAKTDDAGTPTPDAAAEAAAPLGTLCTALDECCDQIEQAGYIPDNCRSVVALKHEGACYAQHEQYRNAGDCS